MKIDFERTGGFAGIRTTLTIDVDSLPADDAVALRKLVEDADFFTFSLLHPKTVVPDSFHYVITVEGEGRQRTVRVGDMSIPETLRPLIDTLSQRARSQRRL
ncbi:MAG: hypothetical protein NT121_01380 [Chloroflexi bacterium]|nr:hypothetical protein [Chloroflexota bacterium]